MALFPLENASTSTVLVTIFLTALIFIIFTSKFVRSTIKNFKRRLFAEWYCNIASKQVYQVYGPLLKTVFKGLEENLKVVDGDIVDLGTGFGKILEYLPKGSSVIAVEPSPYMREKLQIHAKEYPDINVKKIVDGFAENLSEIESGSVAAVTCTLVLCCVDNPVQVLKEIKRILKPGGYFCFVEHVKAPESKTRRVLQYLFNGIWKSLVDNCQLTRETWITIDKAGFRDLHYQFHYVKSGFLVCDDMLTGYARVVDISAS